jgi:hypothetical protein
LISLSGEASADLFLEEIVKSGLRSNQFISVLSYESTGFWTIKVAEVGFVFSPHFFRCWLLAVLCVGDIVFDAKLTYVKLCIARFARIETAKWKTQ